MPFTSQKWHMQTTRKCESHVVVCNTHVRTVDKIIVNINVDNSTIEYVGLWIRRTNRACKNL